jgi:hypothetical protein
MSGRGTSRAAGLWKGLVNVLTGGLSVLDEQLQRDLPSTRPRVHTRGSGGRSSTATRTTPTQTAEVPPPASGSLVLSYAPSMDGAPDAGEIVWTWVPYDEADGRGKDRPVLVIGAAPAGRVYAVRLTSRAHEGDRDYLPLGSGTWDAQGRPSWVDIEQIYSVHPAGMRREAAALDRDRFERVADALSRRYGWRRAR